MHVRNLQKETPRAGYVCNDSAKDLRFRRWTRRQAETTSAFAVTPLLALLLELSGRLLGERPGLLHEALFAAGGRPRRDGNTTTTRAATRCRSRREPRPRRPPAAPRLACPPDSLHHTAGQTGRPSSLGPLWLPSDRALRRGPGDERGTAAQTPPLRQRTSPAPDMSVPVRSRSDVLQCTASRAATRTTRCRDWSPRGRSS